MKEYKENLIQKAENLIDVGFPKKIRQIDLLLSTKELSGKDFSYESDSKVANAGYYKTNLKLLKIQDDVKPVIRQLIEDAKLLKIWLTLLIPKIDGGSDFGISIQAETLSGLKNIEFDAIAMNDRFTRYFNSRAGVVAKIIDYPEVEDYKFEVQELDKRECMGLWIVLSTARNHYCLMHDIITKNIDKLKKPQRSSITKYLFH